jgi:ribokinase
MTRITVVGSLNMDMVALSPRLPGVGETLTGTQFLSEPGGKGANQAYAAALLKGDVRMLGQVGEDELGRSLRAKLMTIGCDVTAVRQVEGSSGVALILVAQSGENMIVVVPGANGSYSPEQLELDTPLLIDARFLLLQLEIPMSTVVAAAHLGWHNGAQVILDPAPAPEVIPTQLLRTVHVITPNESEAAHLVGRTATHLSVEEARTIAQSLRASGPEAVIVKMGAHGCLLCDGDGTAHIVAPMVSPIDTTAAGDVFNGAFAVASSEGASRVDACRFAVKAASLSVLKLGAQRSMPTRMDVDNARDLPTATPVTPLLSCQKEDDLRRTS